MPRTLPPVQAIRAEIDALFTDGRDLVEVIEDVARLGARLIIQTAVEAEVDAFLGRARYQRTATATGSDEEAPVRPGYRNGHCPHHRQGHLWADHHRSPQAARHHREVRLPLVRHRRHSQPRPGDARHRLVRVRPVRSRRRRRTGRRARPRGRAVQVDGLDADAWHDFLTDLVARDLRPPLLIISYGAPGLISAAEQVFPASPRQRCLVHRARNVLAKVSAGDQTEVKAAYWQIIDLSEPGDDITVGQGLVGLVQRRIDTFADTSAGRYPAAVKCLLADRQSLTSYLRFPLEHHRRVRHSNFIERTFGETRRRVKVIGRFPGETSCVSLVWAVLDRAARGWRGFTLTSKGLRILHDLRRALLHPPAQLRPTDDPASAPITEAA